MNDPRAHYLLNQFNGRSSRDDEWQPLNSLATEPLRETESGEVPELPETGPVKVLTYVCTGKLTLFPVIVLFLGVGAGYLLFYGDKGYANGYFSSVEFFYGLAGLIVSFLALLFFFFLVIWLVLRVSFTITSTHFRVIKTGVLRSAKLEFDLSQMSLHYFRTHFSDDRSWLSLVIREKDQFYQIFSWKGKGAQKERFLRLFKTLKRELKSIQRKNGYEHTNFSSKIISKEELTLIGPFASQLKHLADRDGGLPNTPLCIEDIEVISYDEFWNHFNFNKKFSVPYRHISSVL